MNILELKREYNNILLRKYYSASDKQIYFKELLEYNVDLIAYTLVKYFPDLNIKREFFEIGIVSIIKAIENYKMDQIADFEDFVVANIKDDISIYINEFENNVELKNNLNIGDVFYNKFHLIKETLETKEERDKLVIKILKLDKK